MRAHKQNSIIITSFISFFNCFVFVNVVVIIIIIIIIIIADEELEVRTIRTPRMDLCCYQLLVEELLQVNQDMDQSLRYLHHLQQ